MTGPVQFIIAALLVLCTWVIARCPTAPAVPPPLTPTHQAIRNLFAPPASAPMQQCYRDSLPLLPAKDTK